MHSAKRGDLAIIRTAGQHGDRLAARYDLAVVTACTRDGDAKAVRHVTGSTAGNPPTALNRLPSHALAVVPADRFHVAAALATIQAGYGSTGAPASYASPVDLLRALNPHRKADPDCLATLRHLAYQHLSESPDQRCATCGVTTYGNGHVAYDAARIPTAVCAGPCPTGVDYTTDYPVGLEIMITKGFAAGTITHIERVSDAYLSDTTRPGQPPAYAGRSYTWTSPVWGRRTLAEDYVRPVDDGMAERYAVHRTVLGTASR